MSNTFSKSSAYVNSLVNFTLDTKPYHTKLTEVAVEYRFEENLNVAISDSLLSKVQTKASWLFDYFSGGNSSNRVLPLKRLVSPDVLRQELNLDSVNNTGGFKVGRDESTDLISVPLVFDKRWSMGIADAWIDRDGGVLKDWLVEGHDYFKINGASTFQVSLPPPNSTDQSHVWQEINADGVMADVTLATRAAALDISNPSSANRRIWAILKEIYQWLQVNPNAYASAQLNELFTVLQNTYTDSTYQGFTVEQISVTPTGRIADLTFEVVSVAPLTVLVSGTAITIDELTTGFSAFFTPGPTGTPVSISTGAAGADLLFYSQEAAGTPTVGDTYTKAAVLNLPQSYEALLNILVDDGVPVMPGYTGWVGEDGSPLSTDTYVDDALSQNTPPAFFCAFSDLSLRESGGARYVDTSLPGVAISNIALPPGADPDEWTFVTNSVAPLIVYVYGASSGFVGAVEVGSSFSTTRLSFDTASAAGTPTIGDSVTSSPLGRIIIGDGAPLEMWNIIKVNPMGYSRPVFTSTRYGYIRSLSGEVGNITILDNTIPTGTIVLTALNSTTFTLSSTAEPGYTGTATVGAVYNDGRIGFTLIAGSVQAFSAGDKFYIQVVNPDVIAAEFDLFYGYDLDSYDDQVTVYDNQNAGSPLFNLPLGFTFDSRFIDYDLSSMNLSIAQSAVNGRQFRLVAIPDVSKPLAIIQKDGSGPSNIIDLQAATSGTAPDPALNALPLVSMAGDPSTDPDLLVYEASSFRLEYSDDGFSTFTHVADVPVNGSFSNPLLGVSFSLPEGSKPFIGVVADDAGSSVTGGDVFAFTVFNEDPYIDPLPISLASANVPRLVMHGEGFRDAPAALWTVTFTSSSVWTLSAIYTSGPDTGASVPGYPVSGSLGVTGTGLHRNLSYKDSNVHFTVVRGRRSFAAGETFSFNTFEDKPALLVHGSVSGWQPDAEIGKWYWNGKIGFKIAAPHATVRRAGEPVVDATVSVVSVGIDAPPYSYRFKKVVDGSSTFFSVSRDDVGVISSVSDTGTFKDRYLEVALSGTADDFEVQVETDELKFWNSRSAIVIRPDIDALYPTTSDYLSFKKAHDSKLAISLQYDEVAAPPDLSPLSPSAVDINFIDIFTGPGNTPIEAYSPESVVFNGWIPLQQTGYDATNSVAHFSDTAAEIRLKSASSGESVGRVYSVGTLNEPILFEWDQAFFERYLPLNAQATLVTYGTFMDEKVNVHITERVNFLTTGGVLLEDALFSDSMNVVIGEEHTVDILVTQDELVDALIQDGPFGGFMAGYANMPFDEETVIGQYDTGFPLVDNFMKAKALTQLPSLSPSEVQELHSLLNLIEAYLQPGGVTSTSLTDFLTALDADPFVSGTAEATLGLPTVGAAFDINKTDANTATTSIQEAISFYSNENDILFDEEGFDSGPLDAAGNITVIMQTPGVLPIPSPLPILPPAVGAITYADLNTPLESIIPARTFEINFNTVPATLPVFRLWRATDPEPINITIVEQISPKRFVFSIPEPAEAKVIVT